MKEIILFIFLFSPFIILIWAGVGLFIYAIWKEINDAYK